MAAEHRDNKSDCKGQQAATAQPPEYGVAGLDGLPGIRADRYSAERQVDGLRAFTTLVGFGVEANLLAIFQARKAR